MPKGQYVRTDKHRKELHDRMMGNKVSPRGKEHWQWKNGISKDPMYNRICLFNRRNKIGLLSVKTVQLVYEDNIKKYGTLTCYLCNAPIAFGSDCIEHKIPISRGGNHDYNNLDISCRKCNASKSTKTLEEYLSWKKELEV